MMKYRLRSKRRPDVRFSRSFVIFVLFLFFIHEVVAFYLLSEKEEEIRRLESEVQRLLHRFEKIENENKQLRERQRIWDVIEEFNPQLSERDKTSLGNVVWEESSRYGFDPVLLMALIFTESSFRPNARSHLGAQGLMQVMPFVGEELSPEVEKVLGVKMESLDDLYEPEVNVKVGTYHLFKMILRFNDVKTAIKAYHGGPTNIQRRILRGTPMPQVYYSKVMENYQMLREFLNEQDDPLDEEELTSSLTLAQMIPEEFWFDSPDLQTARRETHGAIE